MRRYGTFGNVDNDEKDGVKQVGELFFSPQAYEVRKGNELLEFTTKEFEVLYFFASNMNQVFSKEQIYEQVWGSNEYGDISSVAVYIRRIRGKLDRCGLDYIKTVWGAGYKMIVEEKRGGN